MFPDLIGECNDAIECVLFIERMAALYLSKWRSSPPVSLSLKGNIIGCGRICYAIVHGEPTQLKPVWYSGYLRRLFNAYERSGVQFSLLHFFSVYK